MVNRTIGGDGDNCDMPVDFVGNLCLIEIAENYPGHQELKWKV